MANQLKVLLVEDDRLERMNLTLILSREGFALDVAACAEDAYNFLGRDHYDVVVTDIGLPDHSGMEVLHAAKRADPSTKVLLVTGSQAPITAAQALSEGAESLMLKPFAMAELILMVRELTGHTLRTDGASPEFPSGRTRLGGESRSGDLDLPEA